MQNIPDEGVIKFSCEHITSPHLPANILKELKHFRQLLYMQKLIGADEFGVGYGNISQRYKNTNEFIITGTQTGHLPTLNSAHFTLVKEYNIAENWLKCVGPVKASSESLTHAALYSADANINVVMHVHHNETWRRNLFKLPATASGIAYGSPEMAFEIMKLCRKNALVNGVIIMAGHQDGIISFGKNMAEAYQHLMSIIAN